jgi:large subunit ribosomal protein L28
MSNKCQICGKQRVVGGSITRRGLAKKQGGIGMHVVKNNKRVFHPNIQSVKVRDNGRVVTMKVCTSCIRADKILKA